MRDARGSIPRADGHDEVGHVWWGKYNPSVSTGDWRHARRHELDPVTRLKWVSV